MGKIEVLGARNLMHLLLSTGGIMSLERITQVKNFSIIIKSKPDQQRAFHIDGDGSYITGGFTLKISHIRAVKFLCFDLSEENI